MLLFVTVKKNCVLFRLLLFTMPRLALPNHNECRKLVCCICWNRSEKKISVIVAQGSELEGGMKEFVDEDYDAEDLFISFKY